MTDEEALGRWFAAATQPQLAAYNQSMADAAPYRGAPKWERLRARAQTEFNVSTADARALYDAAMFDLRTAGEVSEAIDAAMTQYRVAQIMSEAAE